MLKLLLSVYQYIEYRILKPKSQTSQKSGRQFPYEVSPTVQDFLVFTYFNSPFFMVKLPAPTSKAFPSTRSVALVPCGTVKL